MPLTSPGWFSAGRQLLAGFNLAVSDVNRQGGVGGRKIELIVRDTAGDPQKAETAVTELASLGVAALAGEYHSVVARTAAIRADAVGLPFLCSSAVPDALIDQPTRWVARLSPPQSLGWQYYADFLLNLGHWCVGIAAEPSIYWEAGTKILKNRLGSNGVSIVEFKARELKAEELCGKLFDNEVNALILLVGNPILAASFISKIRNDEHLAEILIGCPAGQPELDDWQTLLQMDGGSIPFLRYLPENLTPLGNTVASVLSKDLNAEPSFVALEGYDTIITLANVFSTFGTEKTEIGNAWAKIAVEGTRGLITFSRPSGNNVWQWENAPLQIAARDAEHSERFKILRQF